MEYTELEQDFNNLRATQPYIVGKVIDEAQNYIEFLESKQEVLNNVCVLLNELEVRTINKVDDGNDAIRDVLNKLYAIIPGAE